MSLFLISSRRRAVLAITAGGTAAFLALAGPVTAAFGEGSGTPVVQTSETVKANLDASGKLDVARVFSQIEASGKGRVSLSDPTSTSSLRNLDGWGAPGTKDGKVDYNFSVNGEKSFRTVAKYKGKLPVSVNVTYVLDGKQIKPGDLAGKSGKLSVTYKVVNTTAEPTEISYLDGRGKNVTETVDIVTPYVGQLALDLPSSFDAIKSNKNRADQAGDGHGGRLLTWTMVLFEPIGEITQTFGFTAHVDNAVLPPASVQIVPVSPQNHPELKFGQDGFSSGAKSGRDLTAGAVQIDDNLLKLRDGASTLLDGLTQLQDGANDLSTGLSDGVPAAIDGGNQIAKGAQDAADGAGKIQAGSGQLSAGAKKLSKGFNDPNSDKDLIDGSQALASALGLISGGLGQLNSATTGLPAAKAGLIKLKGVIDTQVIPGIGSATSPTCDLAVPASQTLVGCMKTIIDNVTVVGTSPTAGLPALKGGVDQVLTGINAAAGFRNGLLSVQARINAALVTAPGDVDLLTAKATIDPLVLGLGSQGDLPNANPALTTITGGLNGVSGGLGVAIGQVNTLLLPGLKQLRIKLLELHGGLTNDIGTTACNPALVPPAAGYCGISEALGQLVAGVTTAVAGIGQLAPGAALANTGAGDLADGIATAGDGADQLSTGATQLDDGSAELASGLKNKLAPGAVKLADGLQDLNAAKDGAGQLADGLGQAKDGDKQIVSGAGQLSEQGTSQLVASGDDTAKSYGKEYATMQALNTKGKDNAMPVGAPKGSTDNRGAFDITLAGVGHDGPGSPGRGVAAIVILGIGAAATTLLRGRFGA